LKQEGLPFVSSKASSLKFKINYNKSFERVIVIGLSLLSVNQNTQPAVVINHISDKFL